MPQPLSWLVQHRFSIAFAALTMFMGVSMGLAKVTTSLYALHLGAQGWWLGAIAAAPFIGILLMALPIGYWVERFGPRRLFMGGSLAGGALYAVLPLVPHNAFLLAMSTLLGFVLPARFVAVQMVFMSMLARMGERAAGCQRAAHMSGGFLLGPALTAAMVGYFGYAGTFWCVALLFILSIALSHKVLHHHAPLAQPAAPPPLGMRRALAELLRHPGARRLVLQEAAIQSLNMYYAFFIVVIAVQQLHIAAAAAGSLVAVQGTAFIGALLFMGPWVRRLGPRAMAAGVVMVLLATAVLSLGTELVGLWLGGALLGLGLGFLQILSLTQFSQLGSRIGSAKAAGLISMAGPSGALLGSLLGGALGSWWGLQTTFFLFVPVFLLLAHGSTAAFIAHGDV